MSSSMHKVVASRRLVSRAIVSREKGKQYISGAGEKLHNEYIAGAEGLLIKNKREVATRAAQFDVFLNHRGVDTKRNVAGLLYDRLTPMGLRPFMDNRSMKPGDKLYESINAGIRQCKMGVAIFSPRYCESIFCLHELATLVESRKKIIPIFYDVKPSELKVVNAHCYPPEKVERFNKALEEAKLIVGLTFDSQKGDWSELISKTADIVVKCLKERNEEEFISEETSWRC